MEKYYEIFKQGFIDKSLNDEKIIDEVNDLNYEQKIYFNMLCLKTFGFSSFDSVYGMKDFKSWHSDFDKEAMSAKELTDEDKEKALSWKSFPSKYESGSPWHYHGKRSELTSNIIRPLSIKIEVSAINKEDADKIWDVVAPYLFSHENDICFKVPNESFFTKNLDGIEKGNFITIYTISDEQAFTILRDLDKLLDNDLDIQKYTNDCYLEVGNSGVLSAIIDRTPYDGIYIPRLSEDGEVGRVDRPDTFAYLKNILNEKGLLTQQNLNSIYKKEKKLKFGEFISEREKFTPNVIDEILNTHEYNAISYAIGHYKCTAEDLKLIIGSNSELSDVHGLSSVFFNYDYKDIIEAAKGGNYFVDVLDFYMNNPQIPQINQYMYSLIPKLCEDKLLDDAESIICFMSSTKEREKLGDNFVNNTIYSFLKKVVETESYEHFASLFYEISGNQEFVNNLIQSLINKQECNGNVNILMTSFDMDSLDNINAFVALYENGFISDESIEKFMNRRFVPEETKEKLMNIIEEYNSQSETEENYYETDEENVDL